MTVSRPAMAIYWTGSCGGCEVAFLNLDEALLGIGRDWELSFCPCLLDTKRADL